MNYQWASYRQRAALAKDINERGWRCYSTLPSLNVLLDKPQVIDPMLHVMLHRKGLVSDEDYIGAVRSQRYDMIVMTRARFQHQGVVAPSDAFLEALQKSYVQVAKVEPSYYVFRPRKLMSRPPSPHQSFPDIQVPPLTTQPAETQPAAATTAPAAAPAASTDSSASSASTADNP